MGPKKDQRAGILGVGGFLGLLWALGGVLGFSGCAPGEESSREADPGALPEVRLIERGVEHWPVVARESSADSVVSMEIREMPKAHQEKVREELRATDLTPLPIDTVFNVHLFRIENVPEYRDAVFMAPKLYAYSSADGARLVPRRNPDGSVSVSFPVVLTLGDRKHLQAPGGQTEIEIPEFLRIPDFPRLKQRVREIYGADKFLAPLRGCPKRITVVSAGKEYDATPSDLEGGADCSRETPFTVTLRLSATEARHLLQEALYAGVVDVRAVYETRVAFAVSRFKLEFDQQKLFEDLASRLSVRTFWADVDLRAQVTEVVREHALRVRIQGDLTPPIQSVVDQAIRLFFVPFPPDPETRLKGCSNATVCFRLNFQQERRSQSLSVEWMASSNSVTGQNTVTWTKLKPLDAAAVRIAKLTNRASSPGVFQQVETGLTLVDGDLLALTPLEAEVEEGELEVPSVQVAHSRHCLKTEPVREKRRVRVGGGPGITGGPDWEEKWVQIGERCVQFEDRWVKTTRFSAGRSEFRRVPSPIGRFPELFEGLELVFDPGLPSERICRLDAFERQSDGKSLQVRIENRPSCGLFTGAPAESRMLFLRNSLRFPRSYRSGRLVVDWTGKTRESPKVRSHVPEVRLSLELGIRGARWASGRSAASSEREETL